MARIHRPYFLFYTILSLTTCVVESGSSFAQGSSKRSLESSVFAESALVDKETGRIFWEGGEASTLQASIGPKLDQFGLAHVNSALLSCILLLAGFGWISAWVEANLTFLLSRGPIPNIFLRAIVVFGRWTFKRVPRFNKHFTLGVYVIYLLEAFFSGTRRYLSNAISGPEGVESYLESLRTTSPEITWKIRSYHYQTRPLFLPLVFFRSLFSLFKPQNDTDSEQVVDDEIAILKRKIVTSDKTEKYKYGKCLDRSVGGVWRRATAVQEPAPFAKIRLSKLVILSDGGAREDYFGQQSKFVEEHGKADKFGEFSTRIEVKGFRPRVLAIRPSRDTGMGKFFSLALFWMLTLMGMSFPYRVWFAQHADELRVTVVKETTALNPTQRMRSWFSGGPPRSENMDEKDDETNFRSFMEQMQLYENEELMNGSETTVETPFRENNDPMILPENEESHREATDESSTAPEVNAMNPSNDDVLKDGQQAEPLSKTIDQQVDGALEKLNQAQSSEQE